MRVTKRLSMIILFLVPIVFLGAGGAPAQAAPPESKPESKPESQSSPSLSPHQVLASLSPLPERPHITDPRFRFYDLLKELRETLAFMPDAVEPNAGQFYYDLPKLAPDTSMNVRLLARMYETVYKDYQSLLKLEAKGQRPFARELPADIEQRFQTAKKIDDSSFMIHYQFNRLFTYVHWALPDLQARPLSREYQLIDYAAGIMRQNLSKLNAELARYVESALAPGVVTHTNSSLKLAHEEFEERVEFDLIQLALQADRHVQFANRTARENRRIKTAAELEQAVSFLGKELSGALEQIDKHENSSPEERARWSARLRGQAPVSRLMMEEPFIELDYLMMGSDRVYAIPIYEVMLSPERKKQIYEIYRVSVIVQHVLAAGSLIAKVAEIKEGRGGLIERLRQELRYREAQLNSGKPSGMTELIANTTLNAHSRAALEAVTSRAVVSAGQSSPTLNRRDFATPERKVQRNGIEERLWKAFFDKAGSEINKVGVSPGRMDQAGEARTSDARLNAGHLNLGRTCESLFGEP